MNLQSQRDLQLLQAVELESHVTQRTLAARIGIALGLTNLYLRRLIRKGYIKCVTVRPNRLVYLITPRGVAQKARLTYEFMRYSMDLYRDARRQIRTRLNGQVTGQKRVAIYGTGEAAELAFLLLKELNLEVVAVFDDHGGDHFLGFDVRGLGEHRDVLYDALIVASLDHPGKTVRKLTRAGLAPEKLLLLRETA